MGHLLDVVIPTRNRGGLILETIESIVRNDQHGVAVWVIDQSDDDATHDAVAPFLDDGCISYIRVGEFGSNRARNLGTRLGTAPLVAFTDDDCVVADDWISQTVDAFDDLAVDAVFGRVIDRSDGLAGEQVSAGIRIAVKDDPVRKVFRGNRFELDFGHGASMAFRRRSLESVGGFDPLLGIGGPLRSWPEKDVGYRILKNQGTIVYEPNVVVHHKQWRTWDEVKGTLKNYGFGAGAVAARYLKAGDPGGLYLAAQWLADQGVRQVVSGVLKWRSGQKVMAGLIQIVYPFAGFVAALRYPARSADVAD